MSPRPAPQTLLPICLTLAGLALGFAPAAAQESEATLLTYVTTADSRAPIVGARVSIAGTTIAALTGADGRVSLAGISSGSQTVQVHVFGYAPAFRLVSFEPGQAATLSLAMRPAVFALPEIRVRARRRPTYLQQAGFEHRKTRGGGAFVTRTEIQQRNPRVLSDMLRHVPGIVLAPTSFGDARASMARSTGPKRCPIQYFVDGQQTMGFNIDDVRPGDVEGLEIYKGASVIPGEYNRGSAMCGVILIWTRRGGRNS